MKDITDADYKHGKRVKKGFEMKDLNNIMISMGNM